MCVDDRRLRAIRRRQPEALLGRFGECATRDPGVSVVSFKQFIRRSILGSSTLRRIEGMEHRIEEIERRIARHFDAFVPYRYLGNGLGIVQLHDGHVLYVRSDEVAVVGPLLRSGRWSPPIEALLRRLVRPGQTVINVGAHVGYFSVVIASLVGPTGRLLAVEPQAELADLIRRSLYLNAYSDRSEVLCCAAGPEEASVRLAVREPWTSGAVVVTKADRLDDTWTYRQVPQRRLDDIVKERAMAPVDLVLMDTEGYEPLVLAGCPEILASPSIRIIAEFSRQLISRVMPVDDFLRWMQQRGFRVWEIAEGGLHERRPPELPDFCDILVARHAMEEHAALESPARR
jgi:FkbM family methyltransferase